MQDHKQLEALEQLRLVGDAAVTVAAAERAAVYAGLAAGLSWRAMSEACGVHHRTLHNRYGRLEAPAYRRRSAREVAA